MLKVVSQLGFLVAMVVLALVASGCPSDADTASTNLSTQAEQFKVARRIVGINGITDKIEFEVIGRCSIEGGEIAGLRMMTVTCAEGEKGKNGQQKVKKHYLGVSDNTIPIVTQLDGLEVSTLHSKVILKPTSLIPDIDLVTKENNAVPVVTPTPTPGG